MSNTYYINNYVKIKPEYVVIKGDTHLHNSDELDFRGFTKFIYKHHKLQYPKFFKMDEHSRLGFLAANLLLGTELHFNNEQTALLLMNAESTLLTDMQYQESINNIPSPALFVYTLPNIVMGEIAIKYNLKGENIFLVEPSFDAQKLHDQVTLLFDTTQTQSCITGWVNVESPESYQAVLYLVERIANSQKCITFEQSNIERTFHL